MNFQWFSRESEGSDKVKKESLNLIKGILMKGEWEKHENEGFSWEIEG